MLIPFFLKIKFRKKHSNEQKNLKIREKKAYISPQNSFLMFYVYLEKLYRLMIAQHKFCRAHLNSKSQKNVFSNPSLPFCETGYSKIREKKTLTFSLRIEFYGRLSCVAKL